jgi:hypothetical protein
MHITSVEKDNGVSALGARMLRHEQASNLVTNAPLYRLS